MFKKRQSGVKLNYSRLENITVTVSEYDMRDALFAKAEEIAKECGQDVKGWGKSLHIEEASDGVGVMSERYAVVTYTRKVQEDDVDS